MASSAAIKIGLDIQQSDLQRERTALWMVVFQWLASNCGRSKKNSDARLTKHFVCRWSVRLPNVSNAYWLSKLSIEQLQEWVKLSKKCHINHQEFHVKKAGTESVQLNYANWIPVTGTADWYSRLSDEQRIHLSERLRRCQSLICSGAYCSNSDSTQSLKFKFWTVFCGQQIHFLFSDLKELIDRQEAFLCEIIIRPRGVLRKVGRCLARTFAIVYKIRVWTSDSKVLRWD